MIVDMPQLNGDESIKDLIEHVARLQKLVQFLLNGKIGDANIKANSITAQRLDVDELSAITANMGKLTSGEIYGAYIATREGAYPRVEMSNERDLFGAYMNADKYVSLEAQRGSEDSPALVFRDGSIPLTCIVDIDTFNNEFFISSNKTIQISALPAGEVRIYGNLIRFSEWSNIYSTGDSQTLKQALDSKVNKNSVTNTNGAHNHGIPPGATWETSAGTVTWSPAAAHAHNVT